jgi:hypothetical protein
MLATWKDRTRPNISKKLCCVLGLTNTAAPSPVTTTSMIVAKSILPFWGIHPITRKITYPETKRIKAYAWTDRAEMFRLGHKCRFMVFDPYGLPLNLHKQAQSIEFEPGPSGGATMPV